jgi:F-type H+-transporting ATPase subunit a
MKFFPLVFSLFSFICVSNVVVGIIPYAFTISSHIIVTSALALLVWCTVLIYGLYKNGLKFFRIFVPSGIPVYILPMVVFIEVLSFFFVKPVSHSLRLFANMLAGHIALKVFAGFVAMLGIAFGAIGWVGGVLPLGLTVASPDRGSRDQQANDRAPSNAVHSKTSYSNATPSGSFS